MTARLFIALLVAVTLSGLGARAQAQDEKAGLEQQVATLREELAQVKTDLDETRALLDQTVAYLERGSEQAAEMAKVLDSAEAEGFTFGINPRSREVLLAGWRKELVERQRGVPGATKPEAKADPRRARGVPPGR